jgi:hypothetical protein
MRLLEGIAAITACVAASFATSVSANVVTEWNALATGCVTRPGAGGLLDLALVQAAVHDAVQAVEKRYQPYVAAPPATGTESKAAAAAAAAYRVLSDDRICPENTAGTVQSGLNAAFAPYLAGNDPGLVVGYAAADVLLGQYRGSTTTIPLPYVGGTAAGQWRPTPPANAPMAFVYLVTTTPFALTSASQFRPGPPPAMTSDKYLAEYNEVKQKGSVTSHPPVGACPAPPDTDMARFWSGNFVVQWNEAVRNIAIDRQLTIGDTARLLALVNLGAADAGIAVWDAKFHYSFWRPSTAIQLGDSDPNPKTVGDANWTPFIQSSHFPAGSQNPPYPDYVSGANGLTGAFVSMLQLFFHTDWLPFEVNKATPAAVPICTNPRTYRRLSDAAQEVVEARILLGIHFRAADVEARRLGGRVAFWMFANKLRPIGRHDDDDHDHDHDHDD